LAGGQRSACVSDRRSRLPRRVDRSRPRRCGRRHLQPLRRAARGAGARRRVRKFPNRLDSLPRRAEVCVVDGRRCDRRSASAERPLPGRGKRRLGGQREARAFRLRRNMADFLGELRYAARQFWQSRIFTTAAVLTLALGIGGTTAIFTLIHAVMLRSLPVTNPDLLYRIGDGDACCVQGSPQDQWGMYSFPLYERLKAELPEFEELAAF